MREVPEMRGSHLKANVESLAQLRPEEALAVRESAAPAIRSVEEASRVAWLSLELDVRLTDAVDAAVGRARMKQWGRDALLRSTEGPLLNPLIAGLRALGFAPHNALKRVPYCWTLIYRGCGELSYEETGERAAELTQTDAPDAMLQSQAYVDGIAAAIEAVVELVGGGTPVVVAERALAHRRVLYRCRWT